MVNVLILAITIYAVGMAVHKLLELLVAKTKCIDKFRKSVINRFSQKAVTFTFMIPLIVIEMIFWECNLQYPIAWGGAAGVVIGIMIFLTPNKKIYSADMNEFTISSAALSFIAICLFIYAVFLG